MSIETRYYCLTNYQYYGPIDWESDNPEPDDFEKVGLYRVPYAAESLEYFWDPIGEFFYIPFDPEVDPENKRNELRAACTDAITRSSFQSDALGAIHNYDCRLVDQVNLMSRHNLATEYSRQEPLWASDGTRYQWKLHSAVQMVKVMDDMNEHIKAAQNKLVGKLALVDAATNTAELRAIIW